MLKDITFKAVCNFIKNDDDSLIEATGDLIGFALVCSPFIFGPVALPALGLLSVKDQLTNLGKKLFSAIISKEESDYLARMERMEMAYGLICYTAFFDALDHLLPDELRNKIKMQSQEKKQIFQETEFNDMLAKLKGPLNESLSFPHPTSSLEDIKIQISKLYQHMTNCFGEYVEKLSVFGKDDKEEFKLFRNLLEKLPKTASRQFDGQYYELARKYEDFRIWIDIKEKAVDRTKQSEFIKQLKLLSAQARKKMDIGFFQLNYTVRALPGIFSEIKAKNIVDGLRRHYENIIEKPIIDEKEVREEDKTGLSFPKISEAFIPQSYRVLRHTSKDIHLEKEETWDKLDRKDNLEAFLLSFLSSPFSVETPLLILGHPGSGKSLLTKVICAQLMSETYTPIRVPLRDVENPESQIENLIEEQIEKDIKDSIGSWADFSWQFTERPLLIILDGYDELLQASGKVFANYLQKVQKFQESEKVLKRPLRVIITSRVALIDKTTVPNGTTVIRLLEFNEKQRNAWVSIWNEANAGYFNSHVPKVEPFKLPEMEENGKRQKILELAEQPLLLLMLALYDSEENSLRQNTQLDRTVLYDSLLRRFVWRERRRYNENFEDLSLKKQKEIMDEEINKEMKRLGAAAIGMYNRRLLYIHSEDLIRDFKYFGIERKRESVDGHDLTDVESFLGGFFFIHKAKSGSRSLSE